MQFWEEHTERGNSSADVVGGSSTVGENHTEHGLPQEYQNLAQQQSSNTHERRPGNSQRHGSERSSVKNGQFRSNSSAKWTSSPSNQVRGSVDSEGFETFLTRLQKRNL